MKRLLIIFAVLLGMVIGHEAWSLAALDLNTATQAQLEALPGVGPKLATEIISHRPYKAVEDLKQVKGIGEAKFDKLKELVAVAPPAPAPAAPTASSNTGRTSPTRATAPRLAPGEVVNLNTASLQELEKLPGVGPKKAQAIIDGRPYANAEDVMKVKGIKTKTFEKIKDHISVH